MYDPLQVNLPLFDGPLDLLLHLVRKQELDINELKLADLTQPYLDYLERMKQFNLDQGGEFLALAATLVWIKSRTLLPNEQQDEEEPDPESLEEMLLLRLQEYQRFKDAAVQLTGRDLLGRDVFFRNPPGETPEEGPPGDALFEEVSLFALIEAFREALERADTVRDLHIIPERARIEDKVRAIMERLSSGKPIYMHDFFAGDATRADVILTFIALLELVRVKAVHIAQAALGGPIYCSPSDGFMENRLLFHDRVMEGIMGVDEEEPLEIPDTYDA